MLRVAHATLWMYRTDRSGCPWCKLGMLLIYLIWCCNLGYF